MRGVDHLFTGRVERVGVELLTTLLERGIAPVVPPLGMDGDGRTYRVNSDSVAVEVAKALGAVKLLYITTADGIAVNGSVARQMSVDELSSALDKSQVAPAQVIDSVRDRIEHEDVEHGVEPVDDPEGNDERQGQEQPAEDSRPSLGEGASRLRWRARVWLRRQGETPFPKG